MLGQNSILNSSDHNKEKSSYKRMSGNVFFFVYMDMSYARMVLL
jgi:hypothetical protein